MVVRARRSFLTMFELIPVYSSLQSGLFSQSWFFAFARYLHVSLLSGQKSYIMMVGAFLVIWPSNLLYSQVLLVFGVRKAEELSNGGIIVFLRRMGVSVYYMHGWDSLRSIDHSLDARNFSCEVD